MHVIDNSCNHGGFIPATGLDVTYVRKNDQMLIIRCYCQNVASVTVLYFVLSPTDTHNTAVSSNLKTERGNMK